MSRSDRGPLLLGLAVVLLLLAVAAYLVNDAQGNREQALELIQGRRASLERAQHVMEERLSLHAAIQNLSEGHDELLAGRAAVLEALGRIERALESIDRAAGGR